MISEQSWADAELIWDFHQMHHEPRPCSVAVGLGSHDLGVADATVDLYHRGMAPLIVFTGATSRTTRERMPRGEAVHYRERALDLGVPLADVLVEPKATNTGENIRFTRALLEEASVEVESVLLVSKPYEERRAYATARKLWPEVEIVCASAPMTFRHYVDFIGDPGLVIDMLVGALQRLQLYPQQGFMVALPVPNHVLTAHRRLCADGFTSRLVRASISERGNQKGGSYFISHSLIYSSE
ncbi:YdcF family protein [Streptomyces sp. WAC07149]|uniref:YdcF family protein n=1 Tax=Streptomyces sp. WAC07149 TaxID=2487425 RepID=UPI000F7A0513|nr:YdcF family protein [Streptomyces sp. WAC07149]RST03398.1 YdcF family protein [Streptomyces sp. WAC07149]